MVCTGTLNTISASLQLARPARNIENDLVYFEHPFVQTLFMMLGECLCMLVYLILKYFVYKDNPEKIDGPNPTPMNPLVLWPAAFLDIVATAMGYMGLGFMQNPGFFQMLRVTPLVFCGLLSIPFLGQRLKMHNWIGILVVCLGLIIKAIPEATKPFLEYEDLPNILPEDPAGYDFCNMKMAYNVSWAYPLIPEETEEDDSMDKGTRTLIGIVLVVIGEFFHGVQFVYEAKYMSKYDLNPLKVVGLEGINGALTLFVILWPMYFIDMGEQFGFGPQFRFEDMLDGLKMIFDGGPENGGWLLCWTLGNMCSIAVFNFAGISVTKELSATTRAVLDQIRIVVIWIVFIIPLGPFLCRLQDHFNFTAPIGLAILICGVFIYNDVIIMPLIRKFILKTPESKGDTEEENDNSHEKKIEE